MSQTRTPIRRRQTYLSLLVALMALAGFAMSAQTASAGTTVYCGGSLSGGQSCTGPQHTLTANKAVTASNYSVCAGAKYPGSTSFYGSYQCADRNVCHVYSGNNLLDPVIRVSGSGPSISIYGVAAYGTSTCSSPARSAPDSPPTASDTLAGPPQVVLDAVGTSDGSKARPIETPLGTAWSIPVSERNELCLTIPDNDGFGVTCADATGAAKRGVFITTVPVQGANQTRSAIVADLPEDAVVSALTEKGETVALETRNGILSKDLGGLVTVTISAGGEKRSVAVSPVFEK